MKFNMIYNSLTINDSLYIDIEKQIIGINKPKNSKGMFIKKLDDLYCTECFISSYRSIRKIHTMLYDLIEIDLHNYLVGE